MYDECKSTMLSEQVVSSEMAFVDRTFSLTKQVFKVGNSLFKFCFASGIHRKWHTRESWNGGCADAEGMKVCLVAWIAMHFVCSLSWCSSIGRFKNLYCFLVTQATINVGGHLLSATTIEHGILRLPYHYKFVSMFILIIIQSSFHFKSSFSWVGILEIAKLITAKS